MARLASSNSDVERIGLYMEVQAIPSIERLDVIYVQSKGSDGPNTYLHQRWKLSPDPSEARNIRVRSSRCMILNDELYKRRFSQEKVFPHMCCKKSMKVSVEIIWAYNHLLGK